MRCDLAAGTTSSLGLSESNLFFPERRCRTKLAETFLSFAVVHYQHLLIASPALSLRDYVRLDFLIGGHVILLVDTEPSTALEGCHPLKTEDVGNVVVLILARLRPRGDYLRDYCIDLVSAVAYLFSLLSTSSPIPSAEFSQAAGQHVSKA